MDEGDEPQHEARFRIEAAICEQQYGFTLRKSPTDVMLYIRMLMETHREGQKELHCAFVALEKRDDTVAREELHEDVRSGREVHEDGAGPGQGARQR